jgi:hypothetical protein
MRIAKMITPTRLREIYAEELRKLSENNRADRVLDGSDTNAVSLAAIKALHRVADEAPQVAVFDALKNRLAEVRRGKEKEKPPLNGPLSRAEREACDTQRPPDHD